VPVLMILKFKIAVFIKIKYADYSKLIN